MSTFDAIRKVSRSLARAKRYQEIIGILVKNGFGYWFNDHLLTSPKKTASPLADDPTGCRFAQTLAELGPTFIKFGQMLSCRPDLLPEGVIHALATLQADVPPFPYEEAVAVLEKELKKPVAELFAEFPREPNGAASISQGYRARLADGRGVFVKVQRPGIERRIRIDLEILEMLAGKLTQSMPELESIQPVKLVQDFRDGLLKELDFLNEAANMRAFAKLFSGDKGVVVPEPISGFCTKRVLTMSYVEAMPFTDIEAIKASGIDVQKLAELGVRVLQKQIFEAGYFHGDPHPGNVFALPGPKIAYVDFGVMGRLTERERERLKKIAAALFFDDMHELARHVAALSESPEAVDLDALERDLAALVAAHLHGSIHELNVSGLIRDLQEICYRRSLRLAPHLFRVIRTMGYADAMGRALIPDFNVIALLRPYIIKNSLAELNPVRKIKSIWRGAGDLTEILGKAPHLTSEIAERLNSGTLTIREDQPDVRDLARSIRCGARQIGNAILITALLAAGTMLFLCQMPPLCGGCSVPGIFILAIAGILLIGYLFKVE